MFDKNAEENDKEVFLGLFSENSDSVKYFGKKFRLYGYIFHAKFVGKPEADSSNDLLSTFVLQSLSSVQVIRIMAEGAIAPVLLRSLIALDIRPKSVILVDPKFDGNLKNELHSIDFPTLIISGVPRGKKYVLEHISYHDLISGSSIKYIRDVNASSLENPAKTFNYIIDFIANG